MVIHLIQSCKDNSDFPVALVTRGFKKEEKYP